MALGLGTHPDPNLNGRPRNRPATWRYSHKLLVHKVPRCDAYDMRERLAVGAMVETPIAVVERHRYRGCLWHCPRCGARTRYLYRPPEWGGWYCRTCCSLDYPSQRLSRTRRARVAAIQREYPRTLECSRLAIYQDFAASVHAAVDRQVLALDAVEQRLKRREAAKA